MGFFRKKEPEQTPEFNVGQYQCEGCKTRYVEQWAKCPKCSGKVTNLGSDKTQFYDSLVECGNCGADIPEESEVCPECKTEFS